MEEEKIKNVMDAMMFIISNEQAELYQKVIKEASIEVKDKNKPMDWFHYGFVYPYQQFLNGFISVEISKKQEIKFLLINSEYVQHHIEKIIEMHEGSAYCADKSGTIMRGLYNWYKDEKMIEWDYTQEYTFHLPKKVFREHTDIVNFFKALQNLYYGNSQSYLLELQKLISKKEPQKTKSTSE